MPPLAVPTSLGSFPSCHREHVDSATSATEWPERFCFEAFMVRSKYVRGTNPVKKLIAYGNFSGRCWTWMGGTMTTGYGWMHVGEKSDYPHRIVAELFMKRRLVVGECIDHLCKNRLCFRPSHLHVVTSTENIRRATIKISVEEADQIIYMRDRGWTTLALGPMFGVDCSHISRIHRGKRIIPSKDERESQVICRVFPTNDKRA